MKYSHALIINLPGYATKLVTKFDSVNQQFVPFEVSKPATRNNAQTGSMFKSKFCYLIIATR